MLSVAGSCCCPTKRRTNSARAHTYTYTHAHACKKTNTNTHTRIQYTNETKETARNFLAVHNILTTEDFNRNYYNSYAIIGIIQQLFHYKKCMYQNSSIDSLSLSLSLICMRVSNPLLQSAAPVFDVHKLQNIYNLQH